MGKVAMWVGGGLILLGVALGFVKDGTCGSVFQPRDEIAAQVNRMFGGDVRNCYDALDLTVPVWLLIGVGVVVLIVGVIILIDKRDSRLAEEAEGDEELEAKGRHRG